MSGAISGFAGGGIIGGITGGLGGFAGGGGTLAPNFVPTPGIAPSAPPPTPTPGVGGFFERLIPGGSSGFLPSGFIPAPTGPGGIIGAFPGVPGGVTGFARDGNGGCPSIGNSRVNAAGQVAFPGFHWNRSTYTRLGGPCSSKPAGLVQKGTEQVKNRRKFNTANGPARKRAVDRLKAGEKECKAALRAVGFRTISKQSAREMRMRKRH